MANKSQKKYIEKITNVAAVLAECAVLIKRKELLYVFLPIFAIGVYYLTISLF